MDANLGEWTLIVRPLLGVGRAPGESAEGGMHDEHGADSHEGHDGNQYESWNFLQNLVFFFVYGSGPKSKPALCMFVVNTVIVRTRGAGRT